MTETPLETWLRDNGISIREAREICTKKGCASAFSTLLLHPYTLPQMAIEVAKALGIPPEQAAPMGKYIDMETWRRNLGVERIDAINHDPRWYEKIRTTDSSGKPVWLDVLALRDLLDSRGIDWIDWQQEHRALYNRCRTFATRTEVRMKNIHQLADLLDIPVEEILTDKPTITEQQQHAANWSYQTVSKSSDIMSMWCKIDAVKFRQLLNDSGLDIYEAAKRYAEASPKGGAKNHNKQVETFRNAMTSIETKQTNTWQTAEKMAYVLRIRPEEIAKRFTKSEYWHIICARKQKEESLP